MITDEGKSSKREEYQLLSNYINEMDEEKFNKSLVLDYYSEKGLNPIQMAISSRYICILFEPFQASQELHILQRYTHAILYQTNLSSNVSTFHLYDPIDCQIKENYAEGNAHLIMTLEKKSEYSSQFLQVLKISNKNIVYSLMHEIAMKKFDTFQFSAVSVDMKYFAISRLVMTSSDEQDENDEIKFPHHHHVLFVSLSNKKFTNVAETPQLLKSNQLSLFPKIIFVNKSEKALIFIHGVEIQLYDITQKQILSTYNLGTYEGLVTGYYQDIDQYFMIDKKQLKEWKISLKLDQIKLVETNPIIDLDPDVEIEFSVNCIPYHHQLKNMTAVYLENNNSCFCVDQKAFELTIDNIKYSRAIILPKLKVYYAIRSTAPFQCIILDLNNLETSFVTTIQSQNIISGCYTSSDLSQIVISDSNFQQSDITQGISVIQSLTRFFKENLSKITISNLKLVKWFSFNGIFITIQLERNFRVFDLSQNKEVLSALGMKIMFSDDQKTLIVNVSGQYYQFYEWNIDEGFFQIKKVSLLNIISRIDFLPGQNSQVVIYDANQNCLILRDLSMNTNIVLMEKLTYSFEKYSLLSNNLISFTETRSSQQGKQNFLIIYNLEQQYPELEQAIEDQILDIKLSLDQKFVYLSTPSEIKVLDIKNLKIVVCKYMVQNVNQIIEKSDQTYLICKQQIRTQIFGVKTLNPILKAKLPTTTDSFTSSIFLMKYIISGLNHNDNLVKENSLVAYQTFHQYGMVDTFYGKNGQTILHHIISNNDQSIMLKFFENNKIQNLYHTTFNGMSPLTFAYESNKLQHMNIILDYFNKFQENIFVTDKDLLTLMECPLPAGKLLIQNLFTAPRFYKCALPFTVNSNQHIILIPFEKNIIGQPLCDEVVDRFHENSGEDIVLQTCSSIFAYNFERGSSSSLEFLKRYSEESSEEVVRSNLRFIIAKKYDECIVFLRLQALTFYLFLVSFFIRQIFFYESLIYTIYMLLFNTIFILYEINQIQKSGVKRHFEDLWNITDMISFTLFYINCIRNFVEIEQKDYQLVFTLIDNVTLICLLLRGMSTLRVFDNLRYFNNMIIEIIKDMASFTIILAYWIIGFSLMFYLFTLQKVYDPMDTFDIENSRQLIVDSLQFTYRLSFGDFDTSEFSLQEWVLFIISSFFIPLVLFNLIIAVMGDTYDRVQTSALSVDLKEQAKLVMEVEGLFRIKEKPNCIKLQRLLICHNAEIGEDSSEQFQWEGKIKTLSKNIQKIDDKIQGTLNMKQDILDAVDEVKTMVKKLQQKKDEAP
ncbi:serine threonine protein kinase [Stylonychia lemnae]|uniref:Serine threonine protein kinase n=1 Tax=Stylonychia lemnae TaxID=5949 RepID=A0A078ADC1_STYLE|nr:serine threonine protein kinase [Stylonychia lemnae]|eukprot:CDW79841.1 serine threonine protein kinase [Stylonychia lemnae]